MALSSKQHAQTYKIPFTDIMYKNLILNYLYKIIELHKYRYTMLTLSKLKYLKYNEHYVSPNYLGYNYLFIMININNKNLCVIIDKKTLNFNTKPIILENVNMFELNCNTNDDMFKGTIFNGKLLNNNIFLIYDCYMLMGKSMLIVDMIEKLEQLNDIINIYLKNTNNNFIFKLNNLVKYEKLEELINKLSTLTLKSNGLMFFPKVSGVMILYLETKKNDITITNNNIEIIPTESYHIIYNYNNILKSRTYSYENNGIIKQLLLSRTHVFDVYNVYDTDKKIGIALIPNLKISQMCDNIIKSEPVLFLCRYSDTFNKWIPIKQI